MKIDHSTDQSGGYLDTLEEDLAELRRDFEMPEADLLAKASKTTGIPAPVIREMVTRPVCRSDRCVKCSHVRPTVNGKCYACA